MLSCCSSCPRIPVGCSAHVPVAKSPTFSAAAEACATGSRRTCAAPGRGKSGWKLPQSSCEKCAKTHHHPPDIQAILYRENLRKKKKGRPNCAGPRSVYRFIRALWRHIGGYELRSIVVVILNRNPPLVCPRQKG